MTSRSITQDAHRIIRASIEAVLPDAAVRRALERYTPGSQVTLIALGKAAWRRANAA